MSLYFCTNTAFLRKRKGLTQAEQATALNLKRTTYTNYETGNTEPPISVIIEISTYHGVTVDQLLTKDLENVNLNEDNVEYKKQENVNLNVNPTVNLNAKNKNIQYYINAFATLQNQIQQQDKLIGILERQLETLNLVVQEFLAKKEAVNA